MSRSAAPAMLALALAGCASSLSGLGGSERYACRAPEGAQCTSVSGVYANGLHGVQPAHSAAQPDARPAPAADYGAKPAAREVPSASRTSRHALRSSPRLLRLWIAPWEDTDGDLHEAATVHLVVDTGRWLIEHVRPAPARQRFAVSPPPVQSPAPAQAKPAGDAPPSPERGPRLPGLPSPAGGGEPDQP